MNVRLTLYFLAGCGTGSSDKSAWNGDSADRGLLETGSDADDTGAVGPLPEDTATADTGEHDSGSAEPGPGDTGEEAEEEDTPVPVTPQVCYPGAEYAWDVCFDLVDHSSAWGEGYDYPEPYMGSAQYTAPARFIDLSLVDPSIHLAPNFVVSELLRVERGQYGLFQVHALEFLQNMRDRVGGPISVSSAYRNVTYNASLSGSAEHSRHLYGDAVDIVSGVMSIDGLEEICAAESGYLVEYESHVHCDWRYQPLDTAFYDLDDSVAGPPPGAFSARLVRTASGWEAPAEGFDEGLPRRVWSARDSGGREIASGEGAYFSPPAETARIVVRVGGVIELVQSLH